MTRTPAPSLTAVLDELDEAHETWSAGGWEAAEAGLFTLPTAIPKLTAALRAVLALCESADGTGRVVFGISDGGAVWVRDVRAAITTALEAS